MPLRTVFLDWDGTLCQSRFWSQWATGEHAEAYAMIQGQFFRSNHEFLGKWMRGKETAESCAEILAPLTGFSPNFIFSELVESCRTMRWASDEIPDLIRALRHQGARIVIATDNMDTFPRWTMPSLDLHAHFDDVLDSYTLGALKNDTLPDGRSAFFAPYLERLGLDPSECLLIDDGNKAEPMKKFGIGFVRVTDGYGIVEALRSLLVT